MTDNLDQELLGKGVNFPFSVGSDGRIGWSAGETNIRQSIEIILRTDLGERVQLGRFGTGLTPLLFDPNTASTHARVADRIHRSLKAWEPRIKLEEVDVREHQNQTETAVATISYRLSATGQTERIAIDIPLQSDATGGV